MQMHTFHDFYRYLISCVWLACAGLSGAQAGELLSLPTRAGVQISFFWEPVPAPASGPPSAALGTVLLFPGGGGGFGQVVAGKPSSPNFLVRSYAHFLAAGYHVAIMGKPSDNDDLDENDRISDAHLADMRVAIQKAHELGGLPVWLVGTSRGTVSAAHAAIKLADEPAFSTAMAGLVLTASITQARKRGAVPVQELSRIRVPTLVLHHKQDACPSCRPHETPGIVRSLSHAPRKALVLIEGGHSPSGDPCQPWHWHGFVNYERETVQQITQWMAAGK
jgi:pimeloyl-ACP methyl ester carboxylesterase